MLMEQPETDLVKALEKIKPIRISSVLTLSLLHAHYKTPIQTYSHPLATPSFLVTWGQGYTKWPIQLSFHTQVGCSNIDATLI